MCTLLYLIWRGPAVEESRRLPVSSAGTDRKEGLAVQRPTDPRVLGPVVAISVDSQIPQRRLETNVVVRCRSRSQPGRSGRRVSAPDQRDAAKGLRSRVVKLVPSTGHLCVIQPLAMKQLKYVRVVEVDVVEEHDGVLRRREERV